VTIAIDRAYICGPLAQAIFVEDGHSKILSLAEGEMHRQARPNDITFFFSESVEFKPISNLYGLALTVDILREMLVREVRMFDALDDTISGMDRRFSEGIRSRKISEGDQLLAEPEIADFVEGRLYGSAPSQSFDVIGALGIAKKTARGERNDFITLLQQVDRRKQNSHSRKQSSKSASLELRRIHCGGSLLKRVHFGSSHDCLWPATSTN